MGTTPQVLQNPDTAASYQAVFDALGRAYWEASDIASKDMIHGAQEAIGEIITQLDEQDLAANTAAFVQLLPKINSVNAALKTIKDQVSQITKNIGTAATIISSVSKVLALFP
jgi:serine/threonine protein phosphatase PrpC